MLSSEFAVQQFFVICNHVKSQFLLSLQKRSGEKVRTVVRNFAFAPEYILLDENIQDVVDFKRQIETEIGTLIRPELVEARVDTAGRLKTCCEYIKRLFVRYNLDFWPIKPLNYISDVLSAIFYRYRICFCGFSVKILSGKKGRKKL